MKFNIFVIFIVAIIYGQKCTAQVDLSWLDKMLASINHGIQKTQQDVQKNVNEELARVNQYVENARSHAGSSIISNGNNVIVTSNAGSSRSVVSGTNPDGTQYYREIQDRVINNVQYRTIYNYNATTEKMDVFHYTRNANDPKSDFVLVHNVALK